MDTYKDNIIWFLDNFEVGTMIKKEYLQILSNKISGTYHCNNCPFNGPSVITYLRVEKSKMGTYLINIKFIECSPKCKNYIA